MTSCPIRVLESQAALDACAASSSQQVQGWIAAEGFRYEPGAQLAVRDEHGRPVQALICITPGRELRQFASAAATLPPGNYFVDAAPASFNGEAAAFGWWQGQYRFDRYKSNAKPRPRCRRNWPRQPTSTSIDCGRSSLQRSLRWISSTHLQT